MSRSRRLLLSVVAMAFLTLGFVSAQVDDRSRILLERLDAESRLPEVQTIDYTMVLRTYLGGGVTESRVRALIDFEAERVLMMSDLMGQSMIIRLEEGKLKATLDGEDLPATPELEAVFDGIFANFEEVTYLGVPDAAATYEGEVTYADVLSGQQVSYEGSIDMPNVRADVSNLRLVFDDTGELLGQVLETEGQELVVVFAGEPGARDGLFPDIEVYELVGGEAVLIMAMLYEEVVLDQPLDESLFGH